MKEAWEDASIEEKIERLRMQARLGDLAGKGRALPLAVQVVDELLTKLDRCRALLDKWESMANSASDHEAGAAIQCQDDLREALRR